MFRHQTILSLRVLPPDKPRMLPVLGRFRSYDFVRNVMEVKHHLLLCLRSHARLPDTILLGTEHSNTGVKFEIERWMRTHKQFRRVKVSFRATPSWLKRWWKHLSPNRMCGE